MDNRHRTQTTGLGIKIEIETSGAKIGARFLADGTARYCRLVAKPYHCNEIEFTWLRIYEIPKGLPPIFFKHPIHWTFSIGLRTTSRHARFKVIVNVFFLKCTSSFCAVDIVCIFQFQEPKTQCWLGGVFLWKFYNVFGKHFKRMLVRGRIIVSTIFET